MGHKPNDMAPVVGAFLFFASLSLYLLTLAPSVSFWDSGELITASSLLGISHQPGYPLFSLVGKFFSFVPMGNIAYRLNLLSATFSALGVVLVYFILLEVTGGRGTALPAALAMTLATLSAYWSQAVAAEVYALNSFFLALLILAYVKALKGSLPPPRYHALSGFLFGLGIINHMSLVLYLPVLALTWSTVPMASGRTRAVLTGTAFATLGLSLYIYLPIRSAAGPALNLGHPDTWRGFLWVIEWGEYVRNRPAEWNAFLSILQRIKVLDIRFIAAALAGAYFVWRLLRDDWRLYLPMLAFLALYAAGISTQVPGGGRDEAFGLTAKFYIPVFMVAVIITGGVSRELLRSAEGRLVELAIAATYGFTAVALAYYNYSPNDRSRNFIACDYARNSLKSVCEDGVLFTWGDNGAFPLWYLHEVERYRDDAVLVHAPLLTYGWYLADVDRRLGRQVVYPAPHSLGGNVDRIIEAASPGRPVAYDYSASRVLKPGMARLRVRGIVYYDGTAPPGDPWPWYVFRGVGDPGVSKGPMDVNIMEIYEYQRKITNH